MPGVWQQAGLGLAEQRPSPACPSHPAPVLGAPELQGTSTSSRLHPQAAGAQRGGTDALLLPVLPRLKMGYVNQRMEPRTPKTVLWRGAGHGTGGSGELQEKLG